jgi:RimJ/RimL family protein N-acetyltransferase
MVVPPIGPVLETERLLLRLPEERDFDAWAAFMADPEASRFVGGVQSRAAAWRGFAAVVGCWTLRGCGFFSVIDKASGRWAGRVGPWHPEGWPGTEVAWGIAPEFQRRGYGAEAAASAMDFAFDSLGWSEIVHCIEPQNVASIALASKLGSRLLRREIDLQPFDIDVDVYGQSREEWAKNRTLVRGTQVDAGARPSEVD